VVLAVTIEVSGSSEVREMGADWAPISRSADWGARAMDIRLEVVVLPVSDVEPAYNVGADNAGRLLLYQPTMSA
jgi:hypothetical protein